MRFVQHFTSNELIGKLLTEFKISQGPLFHYTDKAASKGIREGEIWMTRADCFLDSKEIEHGIETLLDAAQTSLDGAMRESFSKDLDTLRHHLKSCYVLSLSQNSEDSYLQSEYAEDSGTVLEFDEAFPLALQTGWHSIPNGRGSFRLHHFSDIYDFFEGFVVYSDSEQQRLAVMACTAYRDCISTDTHIVAILQFIDVLLRCLILFKSPSFESEKEYRLALVRKQGVTDSFEHTRGIDSSRRVYIKARVAAPEAEKTKVRVL